MNGFFMTTYNRVVRKLAVMMRNVSEAAIVVMLFLTCADIFMRSFRMPIRGVYDLVSFLGAITVSFAMGYTSMENGHVAVSAVVNKFPERTQAFIRMVVNLLSFGLFAVISWQCFLYASDLWKSGEISPTVSLPYYPIVYGISFSAAVLCLVLFATFGENFMKAFRK
jgi:TRAP-type C4-dicarboxylate transport system permease small subunit